MEDFEPKRQLEPKGVTEDTMAMGDINAVEVGQEAHVKLAARAGVQLADLLTLRGRLPRESPYVANPQSVLPRTFDAGARLDRSLLAQAPLAQGCHSGSSTVVLG